MSERDAKEGNGGLDEEVVNKEKMLAAFNDWRC
jgi:hypothetical protein